MARIQVLPLPQENLGSTYRTPYLLIIDQAPAGDFEHWPEEIDTGAKAILITEKTLDVCLYAGDDNEDEAS